MKKIVLTDIGKFEIVDAEKPRVTQASDVLLRVLCVGVCGSDIHYYNEGRIGDQPEIFPCIIGHEFSAVVEEIGQAVKSVRIGDVVAVDPLLSCGRCEQCLRGRENTCLNQRFIGSPGQADGCLVEYLLMPEQNCFVVPKEMSAEEAALIEPLSIGYYAAQFLKNANKKSAIGIQGVGPIGLSLVLSLKVFGFDSLYCTDKLDYRLTVAKKCGAAWVGFPDSGDIHESANSAKPEMLDYVFECCGKQEALDEAVDLLKPGGTLFIVGIPDVAMISFNVSKIRRKEITIQNVRRQNHSIQPSIALCASNKWHPEIMVTHKFYYAQVNKAFETVARYEDKVIKAFVRF